MNIEKIKNFSQDEQKTLNFFELLRNEIITRDNELNEGIDFIFGRKFANKIDILLNLVITLEDKEELQKENEELKLYNNSITSELEQMTTEKFKNGWFHQSEFKGLIPVQKVKNMIKEKEWALENYDCDKSDYKQSQAIGAWVILQKLLKEGDN